jgi:hypothetical protein
MLTGECYKEKNGTITIVFCKKLIMQINAYITTNMMRGYERTYTLGVHKQITYL